MGNEVKPKIIIEESGFFDDEDVTVVHDEPLEVRLDFTLKDKDILMINTIAKENNLSYRAATNAILRDALDLYHWQKNKVV